MTDSPTARWPNESKPQSWLILALVVALPALSYPLAWFSDVAHRFELQLPIAVIYLGGVLLIAVFTWRRTETVDPGQFRVELPILAVLGVGVISVLLSTNRDVSMPALVLLIANVSLLYAVSAWFDLRYAPLLAVLWLLAATAEAAYALWLRWHADFPVGTLGNKDWLAGYLAVSLLACSPLWKASKPRPACLISVAACYLIIIVAMMLCNSVGAWLGLGVAVLVCFLRFLWSKQRLKALMATGAIVVIATAIALLNFHRLEILWQENVRPPIWKGVLLMIRDSPLIGKGIGTFTYEYAGYRLPEYFARPQHTNLTDHAHNEFLEIAAESGIFGLAAMLWLVGLVLARGWRAWDKNPSERWCVMAAWAGVIVLLVHNQFDINLRRPPNQTLLWLLMGLVLRYARTSPIAETERAAEESAGFFSQKIGRMTVFGGLIVAILLLSYFEVYRPIQSNIAFRKALIARDRSDWEKAIDNYRKCLDQDPYRVEAAYKLAFIYGHIAEIFERKGLPDSMKAAEFEDLAIQFYQQVVALAPDYADVNSNLAYLSMKRGNKKQAMPYLQRAVDVNPYNLVLRTELARLFLELGLERELKEEVFEILRQDPNNEWANEIWQSKFKQDKLDTNTKAHHSRKRLRAPVGIPATR